MKDGTYVPAKHKKSSYGTMVFVRVTIVRENLDYLKKAVCIAVRYSAVRRQSELYPGQPEPQILDYKTQQDKLFIPLSKVFAFHFTSVALFDNYIHLQDVIDDGKTVSRQKYYQQTWRLIFQAMVIPRARARQMRC